MFQKNQNIFKKKKYFIAYGQILKFFQAYFSLKKKLHLFHVLKKIKNGYRNQFMIIH